jgi:hypothetical protein
MNLLALIVYSFGAFAFGAMILLWWLRPAGTGWVGHQGRNLPRRALVAGSALTWACFLWFVVNIVLTVMPFLPAGVWPWTWSVFILIAFAFPPLISLTVAYEAEHGAGRPLQGGWKVAPALLALACAITAAKLVLGGWRVIPVPERIYPFTGSFVGAAFLAAIVYSVLVMRHMRPRAESPRQRHTRTGMTLVFLLAALIFVPMLFWRPADETAKLLEIVSRALPLLFIVAGSWFDSRFEFFDVLVKRGGAFLLALLALVGFFTWVDPLLGGPDLGWVRPWLHAIAVLPILLLLPVLSARIGRWIDVAWLHRRYSPPEAIKAFLEAVQPATREAELVQRAEGMLERIFQAEARIELAPAGAPGAPAAPRQLVFELPNGAGRVRFSARRNDMPFFSEDLHLLGILSELFVYTLGHVQLQRQRQEQDAVGRELALQASRSELKALRAQINPHFLFNALNTIAGLIGRDPALADRTVERLADVFRYTLTRSETEWVRLGEELEFVGAYLEIERARFGERLSIVFEADHDAEAAMVPALSVQTLVENAVKHGVAEARGPATVGVRARTEAARLIVEVTDTGPGPQPRAAGERRPSTGHGLRNVRERLAGYFGDEAALTLARAAAGDATIARLELPRVTTPPASPAGTRPLSGGVEVAHGATRVAARR